MSRFLSRALCVWVVFVAQVAAAGSFVNFESGHVRPLALSPDASQLFAVDTPDNRLEVYTVTAAGLTLAAEVQVGLEPVAVAARTNRAARTEVWVVNHLSDSISIVEIDPTTPALSRVTRTLLVGDEPRDVVFAGSGGNRAFVTGAHRGQNRPGDPQLTTPGVGRADVWAFDADNLGAALGGTPLAIIQLFGDTPRALAVSPTGGTVYAAVFHSGDRTTTVPASVVAANGGLPPPPPGSTANPPSTGLIVKFNSATGQWNDEIGRNWATFVPFSLPDDDVFLIDANANPPRLASGTNAVSGVGTVLFSMAVRPDNGKVYVGNTQARNDVRFEPTLRGHLTESDVTIISGTTPTSHHLNPHIDYTVVPGPQSEIDQSLAFPAGLAFSSDGRTLFVAALGSGKIGVLDSNDLEAGTITENQVLVGAGPSGLVLDAGRDRLYVMNGIDGTISVVANATNAATRAVSATVPLRYDPSPAAARVGRRFLYDARTTSAHGDAACASCHIFGDFDSLAWDLGNPFGAVVSNPNPFRVSISQTHTFHPMKGPMTTQSLRGLANAGPMHWRGDRTGGSDPGGDPLDEDAAFKKFNPAFVNLLGRAAQLTTTEMQQFTDFILTVQYPPNPIRALDDVPTAAQSAGESFFTSTAVDAGQPCQFCHRTALGTDGFSSFEGEPQEFKIPHLRNMYQKIGMFGVGPGVTGIPPTGFLGDQVRGFGFLHDGSFATVFDFLQNDVFLFNNDTQRRNVEAFVLAFDTGLKPAVGQQVSFTPATVNDATVLSRLDLLTARDDAGDCELVVKGIINGEARGGVYVGAGAFQLDRNSDAPISSAALRAFAATPGQEQVYTCVPLGSGVRIGVDRDEDGFSDRTELDAGSDPANPASVPVATPTPAATATPTQAPTATAAPTATQTATARPTATPTPVATATASPTVARTATPVPTTTPIPTHTPRRRPH